MAKKFQITTTETLALDSALPVWDTDDAGTAGKQQDAFGNLMVLTDQGYVNWDHIIRLEEITA